MLWNLPFLNPALSFRAPRLPDPLPPPPPGTTRHLIGQVGRQIEVLSSVPQQPRTTSDGKRIVFLLLHGGFGKAECWTHFLPALASRGYTSYALSLRGHGYSWKPSYWSMLLTSRETLAREDVGTVSEWILKHEVEDVELILVGHSAGGGLVQSVTELGVVKPYKLIMIAAFPPSGGLPVYCNWYFKVDRWAFFRLFIHLSHPRSPLSTPYLLKGAFFCRNYPMERVYDLFQKMPTYESLSWPSSMISRFVDVPRVLEAVGGGQNVLLIAGGEDRLMEPPIVRRAAKEYGAAYEEVKGSGHHVMLDLFWEDAVAKIVQYVSG